MKFSKILAGMSAAAIAATMLSVGAAFADDTQPTTSSATDSSSAATDSSATDTNSIPADAIFAAGGASWNGVKYDSLKDTSFASWDGIWFQMDYAKKGYIADDSAAKVVVNIKTKAAVKKGDLLFRYVDTTDATVSTAKADKDGTDFTVEIPVADYKAAIKTKEGEKSEHVWDTGFGSNMQFATDCTVSGYVTGVTYKEAPIPADAIFGGKGSSWNGIAFDSLKDVTFKQWDGIWFQIDTAKAGYIADTSAAKVVVKIKADAEFKAGTEILRYVDTTDKTAYSVKADKDGTDFIFEIPFADYANAIKTKEGEKSPHVWTGGFGSNMQFAVAGKVSGYVTGVTYKAVPKTALSKCKVTIKSSTASYTGKAIKPKVTVTNGKTTLKNNVDYKVTYGKNKSTGKATIKVTGIGSYKGTVTKTFVIVPKKVVTASVKAGKKSVKVTFKKATGATGYYVQVSKSAKFSTGNKGAFVKKTSATIAKLTSKKGYYVRVKAYKSVGAKKYYGSWSKVTKVTVK